MSVTAKKVIVLFFSLIAIISAVLVRNAFTDSRKELNFDERGIYRTYSIDEVREFVGFPIPTLRNLPHGYSSPPKVTVAKVPMQENKYEVELVWTHDSGASGESIFFRLSENQSKIGGENVENVDINGITGQKQLLDDRQDGSPSLFTVMWYDGNINYMLYGAISETMTSDNFLQLARSIN